MSCRETSWVLLFCQQVILVLNVCFTFHVCFKEGPLRKKGIVFRNGETEESTGKAPSISMNLYSLCLNSSAAGANLNDSALMENFEYVLCFPKRILKECDVDCGMFYFSCSCM